MSKKRYIIVSASHHHKPRALFLSEPLEGKTKPTWRYYLDNALLFTLKQAKKAAGETPIGCYIIEHDEDLTVWFGEGAHCKFSDFIEIAADSRHEIIGDLPQSMQPQPEAETEPNFLPFAENAECIKIALNRLNTESEPREEKRQYVLYRYLGDTGVIQFYFSYKEKDCYSKNLDTATLHTEDEANLQVNKLAHAGSKGWFCVHRDAFNADNSFKEAEQETPAPEAKKRVAHVLYSIGKIGEHKVYAHYKSDGIFVRVGGIIADAYRTPDDAQFAADVLNNNGDTNFGWQVEQIEF